MTDALTAARDLLIAVPVKIRRAIYGVLGLAVVIDGSVRTVFPDLIPPRASGALVLAFGLASSLLALANSRPLPPPPPPVPPAFPDEFA